MKIEKISDTQIQVTLTHSDLMDRDLKLSELAYGSSKAQALFKDLMSRAYDDFGFEAENVPLMIEAVPISKDSIMILVTKVDDPAQIEQKLEAIGERPTHRTFKEPEEDRLADLALMGVADEHKSYSGSKKQLTFLFEKFDNVCMAAHRVKPMFVGDNSLYKYNDKYFLVFGKNNKNNIRTETISSILEEFGDKCPTTSLSDSFLKEHGKLMVDLHAVDVLEKYL